VLVVGSGNSSNAVRLVEVAQEVGTQARLIDTAEDIVPCWLDDVGTVGLTSGASTPEVLVRGVLARLAEHGFADVHEVGAIREHIRFALPRGLRRHRPVRTAELPVC